ncbi:hypothetical protein [Candidatus Viadribacter manganicus]|uniref:C-type lysozyme inhibitor domain-containing protein n=1 Tax=Candidatus Viadribacter manganicus TaxID=1759059 RepID=A0A1B1AKE2_9PROT|nr:hypothetical protein [Candidatus Viadribacter manganicus]ANP47023.1 hypothetical protein ATE48_14410 [Candidatus Viadribacter manganicus]
MKRLMFVAAMLCAFGAAPASADGYRTYQCSNSTVLRVIINDDRATIVPFGRPSIRLQRVEASGTDFRYARRRSHELSGNDQQVQWRVGSAEWTCRRGGS